MFSHRLRFIGLALAVLSSLSIGSSYVVTKKGLTQAAEKYGFTGDGFEYIWSPVWWCGLTMLLTGELMNTAAYAFAPAVLVTPLGALSVLISSFMGSYFLGEEINLLGKLGCAACLQGSVLLVLNAPGDKDIKTVDEILELAIQPLFLVYCACVASLATYIIWKVAPFQGKKNPLVYISICSSVGSVSVMSVKAFGIAVKLTVGGENQFTHASTYVFALVLVVTTLTQMNYLNKAMSEFPASLVNAMYYVGFTTCTLSASIIFYRGLNTSNWTSIISMICGFLLNFTGISLLTLSKTISSNEKRAESVRDFSMRSLDLFHVRTSSVDVDRILERRPLGARSEERP
ncbi:magnesium transporter [Penicillium taxi]|uniref:magnesium transporter n=1 Tax=Penicillium taxi TaxID=168475 RepID=UPI002545BBFE|nr:magnesium transporter [Penicillium taxi]KAJ5887388.1 magnesium transporter [Penicillium taxi]